MAQDRRHLLTELRLEQQKVAQVEAVLRAALRDVTADLRRTRGSASISSEVTTAQMRAQKAALEKRIANGFKDIEQLLATGQQDAARAASDVVTDQEHTLFKKLGLFDDKALAALKASEGQRAASGVEAAIRRISGQTYKPLSTRVYGSQQIASGAVDKIVNEGLAKGWNWQRLSREVKSSIDPNTPGGASYAAKRLARTEINNAYHASTVARAKATGIVEHMEWNLSSSHPENDECDQYAKDSPFELDKVPEKPHPNCYCFLTERLSDEGEFLDNLFAGKYDPEGGFGDDEDSPTAKALKEVRPEEAIRRAEGARSYAGPREALKLNSDNTEVDESTRITYLGATEDTDRWITTANRALRNGQRPANPSWSWQNPLVDYNADEQNLADNIDRWISKSELKEDTELWRGIAMKKSEMEAFGLGNIVKFDAWTSTSTSRDIAQKYADIRAKRLGDGEESYILRVIAPKGTKGAFADEQFSKELVMERGTEWQVMKVEGNQITIVGLPRSE